MVTGIKGFFYRNDIFKFKEKLEIVSFHDGTDKEIAAMLDAHYSGRINIEDYWKVGDTRIIHLNSVASPQKNIWTNTWAAQDITVVITALNHHDLKEKIGIRDKAAITVQTREVMNNLGKTDGNENGCVCINLSNDSDTTFMKWANLPLRIWMNDTFLTTCFSSNLQNMIKETKHKRLTQYNTKTTEEVIDKIFLPSYPEIYGNISYENYLSGTAPNGEEGTQWDYYKTSSNRIKKGNNNGLPNSHSCYWWNGSASSYYSSGYYWCRVDNEGKSYNRGGGGALALAPAFCL